MNIFNKDSGLIKKIGITFFIFFVIQTLLGIFLIYQVTNRQTVYFLQNISQRIKEDISYRNGMWDIHRYIADPQLPGTYPVYLLSADGFVLDRWKPVHGYLDTSNVQRLLSYESPQTITTPTNQKWRMLSKPIERNNELLGVITVGYFNPPVNTDNIDNKLTNSIAEIQSKISIKNNEIDTTNLDVRDINFEISFQIVDKFNRIIVKNNNTNSIDQIPNYTDTSYIGSVISGAPIRQIQDNITGEKFVIVTMPIIDGNNNVIGVIVVGRSSSFMNQIIQNFAVVETGVGVVLVLLFSLVTIIFVRRYINEKGTISLSEKEEIHHIFFDKKTGLISLDHKEVMIPYATNQYYLCEALFSSPKRRWERDELLEKFGEQDLTNWRKVYDAMIIVNKKIAQYMDEKLIIVKDKTYQINPKLLSKFL